MSKSAIVRKSSNTGHSCNGWSISINGVRGYCLNADTYWDSSNDWDESDEEMYKRIVDTGDTILEVDDIDPIDIKDEIIQENAVLVDELV